MYVYKVFRMCYVTLFYSNFYISVWMSHISDAPQPPVIGDYHIGQHKSWG